MLLFVFAGSHLSWVVKLLCFKASLFVGAATSNISLLEDSWLMRLLIDLGLKFVYHRGRVVR